MLTIKNVSQSKTRLFSREPTKDLGNDRLVLFFWRLNLIEALKDTGALTVPALMCPGHQAMAGSLMPPSKVVSFPQRNGPLLPPEESEP